MREAVDVTLVAREQIRGKRLRLAFETLRHLVKRLKRKNGQNRPENLFSHNRVDRRDAVHNRGRDATAFGVALAAMRHFVLVDKPAQALEVLLVHDFAVVGVFERCFAELAFNLFCQLSDEFVVHAALNEHVIGRHARLPAVQELTKRDALGGKLDVRARVHDAWALSAQLKHGGREEFGRMTQHFLAYVLASREEDEVEFLLEQRSVFRATARDNRHVLGREAFRDNSLDNRAGRRRIGARFQNNGIACGDGVGERVDGQQERVVPRAHDERVAVGHRLREAVRGELGERCANGFASSKLARVLDHVGNFSECQAAFAHEPLVGALAQIGRERRVNVVFVRLHGVVELAQALDAEINGKRGSAVEEGALRVEECLDFFAGHYSFQSAISS